jgi:hypothetical protein
MGRPIRPAPMRPIRFTACPPLRSQARCLGLAQPDPEAREVTPQSRAPPAPGVPLGSSRPRCEAKSSAGPSRVPRAALWSRRIARRGAGADVHESGVAGSVITVDEGTADAGRTSCHAIGITGGGRAADSRTVWQYWDAGRRFVSGRRVGRGNRSRGRVCGISRHPMAPSGGRRNSARPCRPGQEVLRHCAVTARGHAQYGCQGPEQRCRHYTCS